MAKKEKDIKNITISFNKDKQYSLKELVYTLADGIDAFADLPESILKSKVASFRESDYHEESCPTKQLVRDKEGDRVIKCSCYKLDILPMVTIKNLLTYLEEMLDYCKDNLLEQDNG